MLSSIARIFLIIGVIFLIVGGLFYLAARLNLPLGKLPGDIQIQGKGFTCIFPLATSILLSILLSIILTLLSRFIGRK
jgi:Zn-dependent protease with chaperone function